ncbi:TPA: filamentous hemagglutinin N-terminal domain-containing protein [Salmonella enterica subsp. enterica serovar Muenchen]|nr:filamentous hemagglutinin N-terminal domain-containing protein [Salmonella enterica subsp. enterica serovar Muenchen]
MNKIYKLKYDRRRNQLVAVSELTTGAGKEATGSVAGECGLRGVSTFRRLLGILTPLAVLTGLVIGMLPGLALANPDLPVGGQVVAGQGSISTSGNQMTIHQGTHGLVTNWHSFDIGQNHTVQFVQPDSSAVALNRVTGGHESQILGTLTANGQVMLVNPAGVMFGKGARVNTAGLLASTKNISTEDFMAGRYTFSGGSHPGAEIVNQGSLTTTKGGYIVLAADRVRNSGTLSTPSGKTVLAAADRVTLQLDNTGLASVSVNGSVVNALVENSGLIAATNGQVYLTARGKEMLLNTVVNNSGTVEARGLNQRGGEIVLDGGESGVVSQSGMLLADSEAGRGGKITVQGTNIHLAGGSRTSATGRTGGGEVYVGGGWQGKDVAIRNASKVVMDRDAVIDVSATEKGDGGKAVMWSEDYTNFRGRILAKGGAQSGNGGQVETSSHHNLQAFGDVEASALNGRGGNWLLDPFDISIVSGSTDTNADEGNNNNGIFTPNGDGSSVGADNIETRLNSGTNVTIKTASSTSGANKWGNITVNADISKTTGSDARLSLEADGNINITNHKISSTQGKLDVNLQGGGSHSGIIFLDNASITTNGGNISLGQLNHTDGSTSALTVKVANGSVLNASGVSVSPSGNISISAFNPNVDLTATELNASSPALNVRNGGSLLEVNNSTLTGGDISLTGTQSGANGKSLPVFLTNATLVAGGDISLLGNNSADSAPAQLELRYKNTLTAGGNITVSSTKAGVFLNGRSATNNISLSAGRNITVQGQNETAGFQDGVNISKATLISSAGNVTVTGIASPAGIGVNISSGSIEARMGNVTLSGEGTGEKGVALVNEKVTAGDITVTGSTRDWAGVLLTNSSLNVSGSLSLKGDATGYWKGFEAQPQGVKIQQGSSLVAAGDLTVTGSAKNNGQGLILGSSTVNSSGVGDIVLTGTAGNNAQGGANVTSTTISAASGNVTLNGSVSVVSGGATGMYLSGVGITATAGDIAVNGVGYDSGRGALRLTGNNNFSAQNTVLSGEAGRNNIGTLLSGNLNVTAGNLSVAGMTHHYNNDVKNIYRGLKADGLVLDVSNGDLTLSGQALAYDGAGPQTGGTAGLELINSTLKANYAAVNGSSIFSGSGFFLDNVTLSGGIEKGNNLTLSSESSGANVTNTLNVTGGIGYSAFEMLQHAGIDNNTSVLVNVETNDLPSVGLTDETSDWTYDAREAGNPANSKAGRWGVAFTGINVSTSGNISLIGVNLTNSNLTGGNLTLQGLGDSPLTVQNTNLTASSGNASLISEGTISLSGGNVQALQGSVNVQAGGVNGTAGGNALSVSNVNFSSLNGMTLSGLSAQNGAGVKLTGNINVTQGDLTVNGTTTRVNNATNVRGIDARGANINVSGTNAVLNMTGAVKGDADAEQTQSVVGLDLGAIKNGKKWVTPRINATSASLTGTSTAKGMGFILNASLSDSLKSTDSNNLNLSSLGSDDAAYNYIGDQVDDDFVHHMIEAGTSIGSKTEVQKVNIYKAELQDWLDDSHRNSFDLNKDFGEWILSFSGLHLNTAGDINITGASFSDSQLWAGGNLRLDNGPGNLSLSGSTLKSRSGYMNLTGGNGINLTNGNISAENDITLNADHGYVKISGSSASNRANVSSVNGSILLHGKKNIEVGRGMDFYNVSIHAQKDIDISADGNWSGVRMTNTSISSESGGIDINASARKAGYDYANAENAALILTNDIVFDSRTGTNINVSNTNVIKNYSPSVALAFEVENMLIKGGGNINASSSYGAVVLSPTPGHMVKDSKSTLTVQEGDLIINAQLDERAKGGPNGAYGSSAAGALVFNNGYNPIEFNIKTNKGNVIINADSSANKNAPFNAFAAATPQSTANMGMFNGFRFSGDSNVSITAIADQADAINLRLFDNTELTGHLSITGKSTSGTGVIFDRRLKTKVINATITGSSFSGDGTKLIAQRGSADLNGNIMTGISDTATGVSISGSNVSITNGTVSGTSGGNGDGVQLTGGTNYTIDGATVTGQSQSGNGIGVGGTLRVSNATLKGDTVTGSGVNISGRLNTSNTAITGNATGNGTGVFVSGTLIADSDKNNYLTGNSAQGNGVFLSETAELTNIVVSGGSVSGTGVVQDENAILTNVTLHGTDGSGSDLGTGGNVNDSGSVLPGESGISDGGIFNGVPTNDSLNVPPSTGTGSHVTDYNWQNVVKQRQHLWRLQASREQDERSLRQVIPASGYREPEKPVVVDICTDGEVSCRHLDAGMRNRPSHP